MSTFLPSGQISCGANYWASHAGPAMWRKWDASVVARDFALLEKGGLQILRIFPLWPDFQPITSLRADIARGRFEYRHGEVPLPDDEFIQSGVLPVMLDRLENVADLAAQHHLDLIVALVTGWMSGRMFAPPALEGLNHITDPESIMWQVRLAQTVVKRLANHPAVKAWDLGNECNCIGRATREQAWVWSSTITNAIRASDSTRPVISGMHSLAADPNGTWAIRDQGEITDLLTTHPYPIFTAHCNREPLNTMRPMLHATAETCLYSDLSGKPAFVEEMGNLGPMFCGDEEAGGFMRSSLASIWAHDGRAALWWCAHDQVSLEEAPQDWIALERELGLLREDGSEKPVIREMKAFRSVVENLSFSKLPPRRIDAVCILTHGQDQWGVAYSAFLLAKQAGFDLKFHYADRALPESNLYLLPSLSGLSCLSRRRENELWDKVRAGATVYVSLNDGVLGNFSEATGLEVMTRSERRGACSFSLPGERVPIELPASLQYAFRAMGAKVLATESNGQPVFSVSQLGSGRVYLLSVPLEASLMIQSQIFSANEAPSYWKIYDTFAGDILQNRVLHKTNPLLGITEHPLDADNVVAVLLNYSPKELEDIVSCSKGYTRTKVEKGDAPPSSTSGKIAIKLPPHGCAIWKLTNA